MTEPKEYLETDMEILEEGGHVKIVENHVIYVQTGKKYKITDPEEKVRVKFYLELINKYKYPKDRIDTEVSVKGEKRPAADIVVYEDNEKKKPYIVAECKKDGISQAEIKQAIEEGIPNAHYLKAKYAIIVAGNVRIAFDIANFPSQEREKNVIADIPVRYGKVIKYVYKKGGPKDKGDPSKELKEVNRDELLAKFQQCHDTLWEGGKRNPAEAFDEMSKLMYCKIQDERFLTKKGDYYRFQIGTSETINEVAERIREIYKDAKKIDKEVFGEPIKTDNSIIYTVVEILQGISLARTDLDIKGEGYEHFLGGVFRGAMGQYFTPRPIVSFMGKFLEPNIDDFIIDPACGSGGFLINILEKMRKELYQKLDEKDAAYRWQDFALKQVYGIEINSQLARVAMMNMIIHEDGHTNIENNDSLDNPESWKRQKIREYFGKEFTLLMTNPPFGADIKEREKPYLASYELGGRIKRRKQQNTEILFIERCLDFLKPNGRMGIVLPDGIMTNSSLQYVRDFITERAQILGVVSLPQTAFKRPSSKGSGDSGSGVKASLLFLRKKKEGEKLPDNHPIFMAIAEHIGYDATGRPDKDEFPDILKAWQEFKKNNKIDFFVKAPLCFAIGRGEIEGRIDPFYYKHEFTEILKRLDKGKYPCIQLNAVTNLIYRYPSFYGLKFLNNGVQILKVQNINDDGEVVSTDDRTYIADTDNMRFPKTILNEGDIIISVRGIVGKVGYISKKFSGSNINANLIRVSLKNEVNPKYIWIYLNSFTGREQIRKTISGAVQQTITAPEIGRIKIPLPPRQIQDKISNMMDETYRIKKEKETEAEELLDSIGNYVLNELGIKLPQVKEDKSFSVTFDKIKGKRFDPYSHQPKFESSYNALKSSKYKLSGIEELINDISGGATPKAKGNSYTGPDGIPFLRIQNITPDGISFEDMNYINRQTHEGLLNRSQLKSGDTVFTITGRIGTTTVIPKEWKEGNINQHMVRLRFEEELFPEYFSVFFNTDFGNQQALCLTSGGSRIALDYKAIRSLKIPVPPLSIQQKIAQEVKSRKEKAKMLKQEAKESIQNTKDKIEKMILGETIL